MRVVVLARKPLEGTVEGTVRRWGAGPLDIESCRVGSLSQRRTGISIPTVRWEIEDPTPQGGRWPSNVVLVHNPKCCVIGLGKIGGRPVDTMTVSKHDAPAKFGYSKERHQFNFNGERYFIYHCEKSCPLSEIDPVEPSKAARVFQQVTS